MQSKDGSTTDYRIAASAPLSQDSGLQPNQPSNSVRRPPPPYTKFILFRPDTLPLYEMPLSSVPEHDDISTMPLSVWRDDFWTQQVQPIVKEMQDFDRNCNWIMLLLICLYALAFFLLFDQLDGRPLPFALLTGTFVVALCLVRRWMGRGTMTFVRALTHVCRQAEIDTFRRYGYALECRLVPVPPRNGDDGSARLAIFFIPMSRNESSSPLIRLLDATTSTSRGYHCMEVLQHAVCMWNPVPMAHRQLAPRDVSNSNHQDASVVLWTTKFWPAFCTNCQSLLTFHRWILLPYVVTLVVLLIVAVVARDMASDNIFTVLYWIMIALGILLYLRWVDLKERNYTLVQEYAAEFERYGVYLELKKVFDGDQGWFGLQAVDALYVLPLLLDPSAVVHDHLDLGHNNDLV